MKYLKLYENFNVGKDIWVIMDENEEYMYADQINILTGDMYDSGKPKSKGIKVLKPIGDVDMTSFKKYSYESEKKALDQLRYISKSRGGNIMIGSDYDSSKVSKHTNTYSEYSNPYKTMIDNDNTLKVVKLFMGVMKPEELNLNENFGLRDIVFQSKANRNITITISIKSGRISSIDNPTNTRFPYKEGQPFNRGLETWACNNNFTMDGKDTCLEKKVFGVKAKDVPQGHEWRSIFPNKFR